MRGIKVFCLSVIGGALGAALFSISPLKAELQHAKYATMQAYNGAGKRVGFFGSHQEQGAVFLFNQDGKMTVQAGAYGYGQETGQSLIGLSDRGENLKLLARLYGPNDSPTLIFKDSSGRDRILIGLEAGTENPYIRVINASGQVQDIIR